MRIFERSDKIVLNSALRTLRSALRSALRTITPKIVQPFKKYKTKVR